MFPVKSGCGSMIKSAIIPPSLNKTLFVKSQTKTYQISLFPPFNLYNGYPLTPTNQPLYSPLNIARSMIISFFKQSAIVS